MSIDIVIQSLTLRVAYLEEIVEKLQEQLNTTYGIMSKNDIPQ